MSFLQSAYKLKKEFTATVNYAHWRWMVVPIHASCHGKVHQILMCTALLERYTEHVKDQSDQDTRGINPAETVRDPVMVEEIVTIADLPAGHDQIHHTALSEMMIAEGMSLHVCVIEGLCQQS